MKTEIVMIGTELLIGQIVDTNATFLGQTLAENGINLYFKTTVGDNFERIKEALDRALQRADVVLTSGGLGPTEDDLTRECIAALLDRPLEFRPELMEVLEERFRRFRRPMSENNKRQAMAPQGAVAIPNPNGTAPGLIVEDARGTIICMPGVPFELKPMMTDSVIPYLRQRFGVQGILHSRVLKVCGVGESRIDELIGDLIRTQQNPTVGVLASPDVVRIRVSARAPDRHTALALIEPVEAEVRRRLPGLVMGADNDTLEGAVDALLREREWRLATAETSTGGMIAQRLTAARAAWFAGGLVRNLKKLPDRPAKHEAEELARRAREEFRAECGLGLAADPEGKLVEAVFLTPESEAIWQFAFWETDPLSQTRTAVAALEHIRRHLAARTCHPTPQKSP
jgi:nicotinamide-nucleotide amidase